MPDLDKAFHAMADPTRRAILSRLALESVTVSELAEPFDISLPAISRHLKVLETAGLITREIEARFYADYSIITYISQVEALRDHKF